MEDESEVIIGTYEDYVLGYGLVTESPAKKKLKASLTTERRVSLDQIFAVRAHSGSVRCVATSKDGSLAVSVGFDEMVNLFSLKKRKLLQTSEGAFNCLDFVGNSHLICGGEDGNIYIHECKGSSMVLAKTLKGHKAPIISLSIHPSEKILLSISKDNSMRTWNLIKGRCAYVTGLKPGSHLVSWSHDGDGFVVAANDEIYLYNSSGNLEHNVKLDKRINSVESITEEIFLVASDSGYLQFLDLKKGTTLMKHEAHKARIKCVRLIKNESTTQFITASSDGVVKLWSTDSPGCEAPKELAKVEIGARLTCMTAHVAP